MWPEVLSTLLERGAADAWLTPILMKKGSPAHTLSVLTHDGTRTGLREAILELTTTLGVREAAVVRSALDRSWRVVEVEGSQVRIKLGADADRIVQATPEFDDADRPARQRGVAVRQILREAEAAARTRGLFPSASWPVDVSARD